MGEYILKLIVGHAITDITEKVYTHRTMEQLHSEIEKITKLRDVPTEIDTPPKYNT